MITMISMRLLVVLMLATPVFPADAEVRDSAPAMSGDVSRQHLPETPSEAEEETEIDEEPDCD